MKSISGLGLGLCVVFGSLLLALVAELYYLLCWKKKKHTSIHQDTQIPPKRSNFSYILHLCSSSSLRSTPHGSPTLSSAKKPFAEENMADFPRFLFTITEETMEDLESEDGIFNNLLQILETPFLTPIASPPYFTPPLTPSFGDQNLSPFWEWERERDAEFNRRRASPPPVFKFLRDAEEKLVQRRENGGDAQFITLVIDDNSEEDNDGHCFSSSYS
ncbi:hypothetical protein AAHA92_09769 [Salvia divinorum]|uniref:Membrane lipoprotein n=1 Tax=Salvia divinorum TaxID=28513 RepID=A0ABD1HU42_SALDI